MVRIADEWKIGASPQDYSPDWAKSGQIKTFLRSEGGIPAAQGGARVKRRNLNAAVGLCQLLRSGVEYSALSEGPGLTR